MPVLSDLISHYGYIVLGLAVFLESAGVPVPGETALLSASFVAQRGSLSLAWVIAIASIAGILGDNAGYLAGRRFGRTLVERHGRLIRLTPERLAAIDTFFQRHGAKTVFLARFMTGLRVFAALFAGITNVPWRRFFLFNALGGVTWAVLFGLVGYFFGQTWHAIHRWVGRAGIFLAAALVAVFLIRRYWRSVAVMVAEHVSVEVRRELASIAATLGTLGLFVDIAEDVVDHHSTSFDRAVSLGLHGLDSPFMDVAMRVFSFVGSAPIVALVVLAVVLWALRRGDRWAAGVLVASSILDEAVNALLKFAFRRPRPSLFVEIAQLHSYSFPSGHAMAAVAVCGMCAAVAARLHPPASRSLLAATTVLALLIGVSRVFLGVHWPTDVLAGYAAGAFLLLLGIRALRAGERKAAS
jgi:membrane protein DedA with SNARE-associated domain/membrane-associated phospholipid phosphatase